MHQTELDRMKELKSSISMANTKDFFLTVAQRVFSNWTALRMAVEHGMGLQKCAVDFCTYITEVIYMNENLSSDDIAAELEDYMDENFKTELQDNSSIEVAEQLRRFHRYCMEGNESLAVAEREKLPTTQPWIMSREDIIRQRSDTTLTNNKNDSDDEIIEDSVDTATGSSDDWVEVKTRRKK